MKSRNFQVWLARRSARFDLRFCSLNLRALGLASTLGLLLGVGCSAKDDGVSSGAPPENEESEESAETENEDQGNDGRRDGGVAPMDAGNPDEREIITIEVPDATCAATTAEAPKVVETKEEVTEMVTEVINPVTIYLMLDRSSSMLGYCPTSNSCNMNSWTQATQAITAFASDPMSQNIDVALGYFPPLVAPADKAGQLCTGLSCATPAVPVRRANDNAPLMGNSLAGAVPPDPRTDPLFPFGSIQPNMTPMECAIRGIDAFCKTQAMTSSQKCVGVLVTDGVPEGDCNTNRDQLAMVAASGGTTLFTLGLQGANFTFLNQLATAGKTDCTPMDPNSTACDATAGKDAFIAALNAIREKIQVKTPMTRTVTTVTEVPLDCEWNLPETPEDMKFDRDKVNVVFTAEGKDPITLSRVPTSSEEECKKHPEGWRYDSDDEPKKVLACEKACEMIKKASGAKISIAFGCKGRTLD
jgi:hypothetical protein